jgi:hypothetical protein
MQEQVMRIMTVPVGSRVMGQHDAAPVAGAARKQERPGFSS